MQDPDIVPVLFSLAFAISFFGGILGLIVPSIFRFGRPERPSRKRIAAISFALSTAAFVGVGVTMPETPEMKERAGAAQVEEEATKAGGSPAQAVISITEGGRIPRMKRSVVVRLSKEISHDELVALGKSIRDRDSNYERVFIEYYLPGMRENAGAWAVTHWKPNLEARILGSMQPAQTGKPPSGERAVSGSSDPSCVPTHQTAGWEFIENNAVRLADAYVAERLPQAVFAFARPVVRPQITGKNKGRYLLSLVGSNEIMQLEPLFDFCTPADKLDDEGRLWRVVYAQYRDVIIEAGEESSAPAGRGAGRRWSGLRHRGHRMVPARPSFRLRSGSPWRTARSRRKRSTPTGAPHRPRRSRLPVRRTGMRRGYQRRAGLTRER